MDGANTRNNRMKAIIDSRRLLNSALSPWMRADEIEAIQLLIRRRRPRRVLEFGAGGSTLTFAQEPAVREWWSLEDSPDWAYKVLSKQSSSVRSKTTLVSCPKDKVLQRLDQLLLLRFDMFFVDAFDRSLILNRLRMHLAIENGFVLLHDASRRRYLRAIQQYNKRTVLTEGNGRHQGLVVLETFGSKRDAWTSYNL